MRKKKPVKRKRSLAKKTSAKSKLTRRKKPARSTRTRKDRSAQIHQGVGLPKAKPAAAEVGIIEEDVTLELGGES
jgi:hypothetical protein